MPGFVPAADLLFFREKEAKPFTPRPATLDGTDAKERADQLALLTHGPPRTKSVHPEGRPAGVEGPENEGEEHGGRQIMSVVCPVSVTWYYCKTDFRLQKNLD